jgi:PAS domain-containing protein
VDKGTKSGGERHTLDLQPLCRQIIEHAPLPMAALEGETHIICYGNLAFCRLVARENEELVTVPFSRAVPEGQACLPHLDRVKLALLKCALHPVLSTGLLRCGRFQELRAARKES